MDLKIQHDSSFREGFDNDSDKVKYWYGETEERNIAKKRSVKETTSLQRAYIFYTHSYGFESRRKAANHPNL